MTIHTYLEHTCGLWELSIAVVDCRAVSVRDISRGGTESRTKGGGSWDCPRRGRQTVALRGEGVPTELLGVPRIHRRFYNQEQMRGRPAESLLNLVTLNLYIA